MSNEMPKWPNRFWSTPSGQFDDGMALSIGEDVGDATASKTDLDALLPMFGACRFKPTNDTIGTNRFLPFTDQIGKMRGCHLSDDENGGIILDTVGQWQLNTRVQTASQGVIGGFEIRQEVWSPEGEMVDRQYTRSGQVNSDVPSSITSSFIVDKPGYWVRVYSMHAGGLAEFRHTRSAGASYLSAQYVYNGTPRFAAA